LSPELPDPAPLLLASIVERPAPDELPPEDVPGELPVAALQAQGPSVPSCWQVCVLSRPLGHVQSCV
jgi:hypothetical protein